MQAQPWMTFFVAVSISFVSSSSAGNTSLNTPLSSAQAQISAVARDAKGLELRASLELHGSQLLLHVPIAEASSPLVVDPVMRIALLTPSDGVAGAGFGAAMAISGDTLVVAVPTTKTIDGGAYVFVKPSTGWADMTQTAKLTGGSRFRIGPNVSISGDTIVASSSFNTAILVFVKPASGWADMTEAADLIAPAHDRNSAAVAISGDTIIGGNGSNSAYVYVKPATGWVTTSHPAAQLLPSDGLGGNFGDAITINGPMVAVGNQAAINFQGAVYLYLKPTAGWSGRRTEIARLTSNNPAVSQVGFSVAMNADTVVAGAIGAFDGQGAIMVFVKPAGGWTDTNETADLSTLDGFSLGDSVAISGKTILGGAPATGFIGKQGEGVAYIFHKPDTGWVSTFNADAEIIPADGQANETFGRAVILSGTTMFIGAPGINAGEVYVYKP